MTQRMIRSSLMVVATSGLVTAAAAQSNFWIYLAQPTGTVTVQANGGAVAGTAPTTRYVADDITLAPGYAGQTMTAYQVALFNGNTTTVQFRTRMRMHFQDGAVAGLTGILNPNTYYAGHTFSATTLSASSYTRWTLGVAPGTLIPASPIWVGFTVDNNSNAAGFATVAQLNNIGWAYWNVPQFGSSTNTMFLTTNPSVGNVTNPVGAQFQTAAAGVVTNMGVGIAVAGQNFTGTLNLNDALMAVPRTITFEVKSGTISITSGSIVVPAGQNNIPFTLTVPAVLPTGATNPLTVELDGASFLKRKVTQSVTVPQTNPVVAIPVGQISLTNGDSDNSGEVDAADIDLVIADFGGNGVNTDVDASGEVDAADIDIVIANFGAFND